MAHKDKVYFVRVPEDIYKKIGALADADDRSINSMAVRVLKKGLQGETTPPAKKYDYQTPEGQAEVVKDILKQTTPEKNNSEANASGVSSEQPCCLNELQPCKHWVLDTQTGEGYRNVLSGRFLEVD